MTSRLKLIHRACEFASPGFVCLEGSGTKCVFVGGCTTVACNGPR